MGILSRQKTVLAILDAVGRELGHTTLVKLAFLVRTETRWGRVGAFYDFVPYKYGPFSFTLYRDLRALAASGYLVETEETVSLGTPMPTPTVNALRSLPLNAFAAVRQVVTRYGKLDCRSLVHEVYRRYPWYAVNSEIKRPRPCPIKGSSPATTAVYTIGYEGRSVDCFLHDLLLAGIQAIVDVRANPVSRKYGFARRSLSALAKRVGLDYSHLPQLGIPSAHRKGLTDEASYQQLLNRYEFEMLPQRVGDIDRLIGLLARRPSALMCMEKDARMCHRSRLAGAASRLTGWKVLHL